MRIAEVKTATGIFERPIHRLALLFREDEKGDSLVKNSTALRPMPKGDKHVSATKRTSFSTNLLTMLITLLLISVTTCKIFMVKRFPDEPSLYFEGIRTYASKLRIVVQHHSGCNDE